MKQNVVGPLPLQRLDNIPTAETLIMTRPKHPAPRLILPTFANASSTSRNQTINLEEGEEVNHRADRFALPLISSGIRLARALRERTGISIGLRRHLLLLEDLECLALQHLMVRKAPE